MPKNKTIFVITAVFLLLCGCIVPLFSLAVTLPPESGVRQAALTLFWGAGCLGLPLFAVAGLGWTVWDNWRSRQVARKLAEALALAALNDETNLLRRWYGGVVYGRSFAIKPVVFATRSYDGFRHRSGIGTAFYLRLALAVNLPRPLNVTIQRSHSDQNEATTVSEAFPLLENEARLSTFARQALLQFVQNGNRNLQLLDRAAASAALLGPDVLPGAAVVLIHDQPRITAVTLTGFQTSLDELSAVADALEASR
jgi:hypothetical protein